jgi:hypothetical protein
MVLLFIGMTLFVRWKNHEPLFTLFPEQAVVRPVGCGQQVVALVAGQPGDTVLAHACLSQMPRFAKMSDAEFAQYVIQSAPARPQAVVFIGSTAIGAEVHGKAYTVEVYLVHDGYPETTYTIFLDGAGKVVTVA